MANSTLVSTKCLKENVYQEIELSNQMSIINSQISNYSIFASVCEFDVLVVLLVVFFSFSIFQLLFIL
jgi:hypothetical protein